MGDTGDEVGLQGGELTLAFAGTPEAEGTQRDGEQGGGDQSEVGEGSQAVALQEKLRVGEVEGDFNGSGRGGREGVGPGRHRNQVASGEPDVRREVRGEELVREDPADAGDHGIKGTPHQPMAIHDIVPGDEMDRFGVGGDPTGFKGCGLGCGAGGRVGEVRADAGVEGGDLAPAREPVWIEGFPFIEG